MRSWVVAQVHLIAGGADQRAITDQHRTKRPTALRQVGSSQGDGLLKKVAIITHGVLTSGGIVARIILSGTGMLK